MCCMCVWCALRYTLSHTIHMLGYRLRFIDGTLTQSESNALIRPILDVLLRESSEPVVEGCCELLRESSLKAIDPLIVNCLAYFYPLIECLAKTF